MIKHQQINLSKDQRKKIASHANINVQLILFYVAATIGLVFTGFYFILGGIVNERVYDLSGHLIGGIVIAAFSLLFAAASIAGIVSQVRRHKKRLEMYYCNSTNKFFKTNEYDLFTEFQGFNQTSRTVYRASILLDDDSVHTMFVCGRKKHFDYLLEDHPTKGLVFIKDRDGNIRNHAFAFDLIDQVRSDSDADGIAGWIVMVVISLGGLTWLGVTLLPRIIDLINLL